MENISIEAVAPPATLGEGPHWEEAYGSLLYVDIMASCLHRYYPQSGRHQQLKLESATPSSRDTVGFAVPCKEDPSLIIVGIGRTLAGVKWTPEQPDQSTTKPFVFTAVDADKPTRFNDAKCDPQGRLWAGTMGLEVMDPKAMEHRHLGTLYRVSSDGQTTASVEKVGISNGLAWSLDSKTFYYIDSMRYSVDAFDYDVSTGEICNMRSVCDYKKEGVAGLPDGMTIDTHGNLWVANFGGGQVVCIDPKSQQVIHRIDMPAQNTTSLCWGGPDYCTLYCTSATCGQTPQQLQEKPLNGAVFAITGLPTKGLPSVNVTLSEAVRQKLISNLK